MFKNIKKRILKRNMESFEINLDDLKIKRNNGAIIIDVRSSQEYEEGHLENAINIPYYEIKNKINKISNNKEKEIVLYCEAGTRSKKAYKILKRLQYQNVYSLHGGIEKWI